MREFVFAPVCSRRRTEFAQVEFLRLFLLGIEEEKVIMKG